MVECESLLRPGVVSPPDNGLFPGAASEPVSRKSAAAPVPHLSPATPLPAAELHRIVRAAAFDLLARREHARQELVTKLQKRFSKRTDLTIDKAMIAAVVDGLSSEGLQSDSRYLDNFVHARKKMGYGPRRIAQELRQKGALADTGAAMAGTGVEEWMARAREVRCRKFGEELPVTPKERARQMRFLQYRGFSMEQIRFALT